MSRKEYFKKRYQRDKIYWQEYYANNKERISIRMKKYREDNKEGLATREKAYRQTPAGKVIRRRFSAKRRTFGFIPVNKPQEGYEGHHIDTEHVVYIPKEIHQSIYHCVHTWQGMDAMNVLALPYI